MKVRKIALEGEIERLRLELIKECVKKDARLLNDIDYALEIGLSVLESYSQDKEVQILIKKFGILFSHIQAKLMVDIDKSQL